MITITLENNGIDDSIEGIDFTRLARHNIDTLKLYLASLREYGGLPFWYESLYEFLLKGMNIWKRVLKI